MSRYRKLPLPTDPPPPPAPMGPATPAPLDVRGLIVLLERLMYAQHYGGALTDHMSVMPGDRVDTCADSPCPEVRAAITPAPLDVVPLATQVAVTRWEIDVDRLARALLACGWPTVAQPRYADAIAREYAKEPNDG